MTAAAAAERLQPPRTAEIFIALAKSLGRSPQKELCRDPGRLENDAGWTAGSLTLEDHNLRHLNFFSKKGCTGVMPHALCRSSKNAGWSSLVARQAHNLKVAGSNPAPATNLILLDSGTYPREAANLEHGASCSKMQLK
jgi:hypothetical protein